MSEYKPWKALERRHAKRMNGVRLWRPDYSDSEPDGESDTETWDCKVRASHAVVSTFVDCFAKYRDHANGRRFHLCLYSRKHPGAGDFVVLRADEYAADRAELLERRALMDSFTEAFTSSTKET